MNETIIYQCHFWNEFTLSAWNKLLRESNRNCYLLFDETHETAPELERLITVTVPQCKALGLTVHGTGIWHNPEFAVMPWKDRIEGDYFWRIDHDVRFTGNWQEFFDGYAERAEDLLAPRFKPYDGGGDGWPWWSSCNCLVPLEKRFNSHLCIYRASRKALDELERQYKAGQTGLSEMIMPTLLVNLGYSVDVLEGDYFDQATFKTGPIRSRTNSHNRIEHPIRESRSRLEVESCRETLSKWCVGNGLDLGFGGSPIVSSAICIDRPEGHSGRPVIQNTSPTHIVGESDGLGWFTDNSLDYVFSSHLLEDFLDTRAVLREWLRVIKHGGHLILFLPDQATYVKYCQAHNTLPNGAHKHPEFSLAYVKDCLPPNAEVVEELWPFPGNPYSFSLVVKKV